MSPHTGAALEMIRRAGDATESAIDSRGGQGGSRRLTPLALSLTNGDGCAVTVLH